MRGPFLCLILFEQLKRRGAEHAGEDAVLSERCAGQRAGPASLGRPHRGPLSVRRVRHSGAAGEVRPELAGPGQPVRLHGAGVRLLQRAHVRECAVFRSDDRAVYQ